MSRPRSVVLYFFPVFLSACVSTTPSLHARKEPDILQRRVHTWLGLPREFLEKHWGIAQITKDMGQGLRYLQYKAKSKRKQKDSCLVVFTVDITGTVRGGQWTGDRGSCLSFVREVPSMAPKQTLVSF